MRYLFRYVVFGILVIAAVTFLFQWYQTTGSRVHERLVWPRSKTTLITHGSAGTSKTTDKRVYYYSYSTTPAIAAVSDKDVAKKTEPAPEAILKYVLFSVSYDSHINAGQTESLQLTMSPKSVLDQLENAVKDKKLQENQINTIEKIQSQYKYVSATLLAKDNCLQIEKKMPEEDKVYLHSINESAADEVWQWDITAPDVPTTSLCNLSLYIRFCLNQNDCIPSIDPDKKFAIFIHITLAHKMYTWFFGLGNIAHYATAITGLMAVFISVFFWIKKRASKKDKNRR